MQVTRGSRIRLFGQHRWGGDNLKEMCFQRSACYNQGSKMSRRPLDDTTLASALSLLEERYHPLAVLLFGSHTSGHDKPDSDVDLGLFLGRAAPDAFSLAATRTDLEEILRKSVDLLVLDTASPILRMEVLRRHRTLVQRDPERFEQFVVRTLGEYFDLKRVREPIERALFPETSR
jgi:predicted nucleotidyltransferase